MKTVDFNSTNRSMFRTVFVLAGLAGLYYYYRRGGTTSNLIRQGWDTAQSARNKLAQAVGEPVQNRSNDDDIDRLSDQVDRMKTPQTREIPMTPESMDRFPST